MPKGVTQISASVLPEPTFMVDFLENGDDDKENNVEEMAEVVKVDATCGQDRPYLALMTRNERLTAEDHFQVFKFGEIRCFSLLSIFPPFFRTLG